MIKKAVSSSVSKLTVLIMKLLYLYSHIIWVGKGRKTLSSLNELELP